MSELVKTILVDFDGVIHSYISGWKGVDVIPDPPVSGAIDWLGKMVNTEGIRVCVYSSRSKSVDGVNAMKRWLIAYSLPASVLHEIDFPTEKPAAWLTIDDRAIQFQGVFPSTDEINDFKPWYKK